MRPRRGRVTVLEAEPQIGYHATGRSAAIFIRNYGNATLRALNAVAEPIFEHPGEISDRPILSPRGELMIASEAELPVLDAYLDGAVGVERLTGDEAAEIVPILRPERIAGALIERGARGIDVDLLLQGYARMLRAHGGRIVTGAGAGAAPRGRAVAGRDRAGPPHRPRRGQRRRGLGRRGGRDGRPAADRVAALPPLRRDHPRARGARDRGWPIFGSIAETWYAKPARASSWSRPPTRTRSIRTTPGQTTWCSPKGSTGSSGR